MVMKSETEAAREAAVAALKNAIAAEGTGASDDLDAAAGWACGHYIDLLAQGQSGADRQIAGEFEDFASDPRITNQQVLDELVMHGNT